MNFLQQYIRSLLHRLLGKDLDEKVRNYFISGAYKSVFMQACIALLTFITSLFIARVTGDEGFGVYTTVFTWIAILSVLATFGLDDLVLKKLPVYKQQKATSKIKGLVAWSNLFGLLLGLTIGLTFLFLIYVLPSLGLYRYVNYFQWAIWVVPLFVLMHINQAILRSLHHFGWGQFAEKFVQPFSFFILLVLFYCIFDYQLTDKQAVVARCLSFVAAAIAALFLMLRFSRLFLTDKGIELEQKAWFSSCRYFALMSVLYIVNTRIDIVYLGLYQVGDASIAHYNAALKLSDLALIPFVVLYTVTAPMYAQLYANKKQQKLQSFFTKTTRLAFFVVSIILFLLMFGGEYFLMLFGENFKAGYTVLIIMCLAKLIHVFFGPVNYLLMMIDFEKEAAIALCFSVLITFLGHTILIPTFAIEGAAIASLIGLLSFEIVLSYIAYKKAGIIPTIIGRFSRKIK